MQENIDIKGVRVRIRIISSSTSIAFTGSLVINEKNNIAKIMLNAIPTDL